MFVLYVRNFKLKLAILFSVFTLWVIMFFISGFIVNRNLVFQVSVENCFSVSYPYGLEVNNVYVNKSVLSDSIVAGSFFKRPLTQSFTNFDSVKGKFSFSYPTSFNLSQQQFEGSDILYHVDFNNISKTTHGFVQVWNLPYSLEEFLKNSKETSDLTYKYFNSKPIKVNGLPGVYWDYVAAGRDGKYYKGAEVFLKKNNKMYRISYFTPENMWNENEASIFWSIVKSFKAY